MMENDVEIEQNEITHSVNQEKGEKIHIEN
jgi:hypothetical protein